MNHGVEGVVRRLSGLARRNAPVLPQPSIPEWLKR
jgi:hypothetical protein